MARAPSHTDTRYRLATRRLIFVDTPFNFCRQSIVDEGITDGSAISCRRIYAKRFTDQLLR